MEQQTQAMCSMFAMLRARARGSITTGRERMRLLVSLQHQKQTGNSKLGLSSCRESHRQKGGISQAGSSRFVSCEGCFPTQEPDFPRASTMTKVRLNSPLLNQLSRNHQCYNGNREGRKEERKERRKEERRRGVPTGIRTRDVRFYSYVDNH